MRRSDFGYIEKIDREHYRCYWRNNGKRCSKRCKSRREASDFLAKVKLTQGKIDYSVTYEEYYKKTIEPLYKNLSQRTAYDYKKQWEKIAPIIGKHKIANTNWRFVQNILDQFTTNSMQKKSMRIINKILNMAVKDEIIPANPCTVGMNYIKVNKIQKNLYTKEEMLTVLNAINNTEFAIPVLLECCCGLRHEEFCGLTLSDFTKAPDGWVYINIARALTEVAGHRVMKETKTVHSERTIPLHNKFVDYFENNIQYMTEKQYLDDFIAPGVYRHRWNKYCKSNNIRYVPFGHMRSVYATLCSEAGCIDSLVQKSMGHSGKSIKEKNYQSTTMKALKINAGMLIEYLMSQNEAIIGLHQKYVTETVKHQFKINRNANLENHKLLLNA